MIGTEQLPPQHSYSSAAFLEEGSPDQGLRNAPYDRASVRSQERLHELDHIPGAVAKNISPFL